MGNVYEVLWYCLVYFAKMDESNAAIHCAPVRYSPITFRLADLVMELIDELPSTTDDATAVLNDVNRAVGTYEEDKGR